MLTIHNCVRCSYQWGSRLQRRPDRCPGCKRPNFWRPKRIPRLKPLENRGPGKPLKYPVNLLNVGQEMTIPKDTLRKNPYSVRASVVAWAKRHGRTFKLTSSLAGLHVRRVM